MAPRIFISSTLHSGNRGGQKLLAEIAGALPRGFAACFIGAFHDDDPKWSKVTLDALRAHGAAVQAPRLSDPKVDVAAARAAIAHADLLYLDGGDTVAGVAHVRAHKLEDAFAHAQRNARAIFGLSGGACAVGPFTIGYDDADEPRVERCLDLGIEAPLDVHDEKNEWPEMRALLKLVRKKRGLVQEGIVVPTGSVLVREPDGTLRTVGKEPCERRSLDARGKWRVTALP